MVDDVDVQNYARFLLKEGDDQEKRDLISCLRGEILLDSKTLSLKAASS